MKSKKIVLIAVVAVVGVSLALQLADKRVLVWERWVSAELRPVPAREPGKIQRLRSTIDSFDCYYFTGRSVKKHIFPDSRDAPVNVGVDQCPFVIGSDD